MIKIGSCYAMISPATDHCDLAYATRLCQTSALLSFHTQPSTFTSTALKLWECFVTFTGSLDRAGREHVAQQCEGARVSG